MKDRHLYRGQRVDNGEFVEGDLVHGAFNGISKIIEVGIKQGGCYPIEVIPETVGQATGLKDKNGKLIFEGDKVSDKYTEWVIVRTEYDGFMKDFANGVSQDNLRGIELMDITGSIHDKE